MFPEDGEPLGLLHGANIMFHLREPPGTTLNR